MLPPLTSPPPPPFRVEQNVAPPKNEKKRQFCPLRVLARSHLRLAVQTASACLDRAF